MPFEIRAAHEDDISDILALIRAIAEYEHMLGEVVATEASLRKAMFSENIAKCLLALEDDKVVGYALYFYNFSTFTGCKGLYLEDLFLDPSCRKKGYGKKLFSELVAIAKAEECKRMEWCCLNWNIQGKDFYKALGAKPMDEWTTWRLIP